MIRKSKRLGFIGDKCIASRPHRMETSFCPFPLLPVRSLPLTFAMSLEEGIKPQRNRLLLL